MINHEVRAHRSKDALPREDQLAWKIAAVASDPVGVESDATDTVSYTHLTLPTICSV